MDPIEKETAVRGALEAFLEPRQLDQAMHIWHAKYADKPTFALQGFVRECSSTFSLEKWRNAMYINLVQHLSTVHLHLQSSPIASPPPTTIDTAPPQEKITNQPQRPERPDPVATYALPVCKMVIEQLCGLAGSAAAGEIRGVLQTNLDMLHLSTTSRIVLDNWLSGKAIDTELLEMTVPSMQRLVNCAYVALCEYFGPVKADKILAGAVRQVSQTPSGRRFHPRNLL